MALVAIPGATATVTVGSGNIVFSQVSLDHGDDLLPIMAFGRPYVEAVTGLKRMSGELAGPLVANASGTDPFVLSGTTATLTITFSVGCSATCSCVFGSLRTSMGVDGLGVLSIGFAKGFGSSDPVFAWDTVS